MAGLQGRENTLTRELPGGWRQRLALGCAILHEPRIVFLDEPTGGVDPLSRRRFWDLIGDLSRQGVTVLVTTHYLDEAEHCHRIAIIQAGKLAALGTATELKQVFSSRPIVEIHASQPVQAMAILDKNPNVEKTSLFGTAVHAVLKNAVDRSGGAGGGAQGRGHRGHVDRRGDARRSKTSSSTSSNAWERRDAKDAGGGVERAAADPARSAIAADPAVRAGVLPAAVRLRAELRHPQRDAGRAGPGSQHQEPRAGVVVRQLRLLLAGRLRRFADRARSPGRRGPRARDPVDSRRLRARPVAAPAGHGAGDHRRRQRQHRIDRDGLRANADRRIQLGADARSLRA